MDANEQVVSACREVVRMDNWLAELGQRKKYGAQFGVNEVKIAEARMGTAIERLEEAMATSEGER